MTTSPEPDVDVLLPTRGRTHTLAAAVESVLRQTHQAFRLHLVLDGVSAETVRMARGFADPRVEVHLFAKAPGFGYANRNRVLRETRAPIVAYMNDDDLLFPEHLARAVAALREGGLDMVTLSACAVQFPGTLDPHFFAFDWRGRFARHFLRHWFMGSVNCVHRRSAFERVGYWNDALSRFGDREFYNRLRRSGLPFRHLDDVTILRFYALHWDALYGALPEAPQGRFLTLLGDPAWCASVRAAAGSRHRDVAVRLRQVRDFLRFGTRSGPRFARFFVERALSRRHPAAA